MQTSKLAIIILLILISLGLIVLVWTILNSRTNQSKSTPPPITYIPASHLVSLTSDIATVSAEITNRSWLSDNLSVADLWGKDKVAYFEPSGFQRRLITVNSLEVHLTDQPQTLGKTISILPDGSKYVYQAYGMNYQTTDSHLTLNLFVEPGIIASESDEELVNRFSGLFWSTIFDITHPLLPEHTSFEDRLVGKLEFIKDHVKFPDDSFMLIRKTSK